MTARSKLITGIIVLLIALAGAWLCSLVAGESDVSLWELFDKANRAVLKVRTMRALLGMFVGAGLAVAGLMLQAVLRNPLADPYVLGVSSGAGLGGAIAIQAGVLTLGAWALPATAFLGGLIAIVLVYSLARIGKVVPVYTLLLAGVIVNSVAGSFLIFIVHTSTTNKEIRGVMMWLLGSLQVYDVWTVVISGAIVASGTVLAIIFARDLNVLSIGEEPAAHLGVRVERTKKLLFVVSSLITGAAVAACGLVGFVGLIVPHAVRLVVGPDNKVLVPLSALAGGAFLVFADVVGRTIIAPKEVPIGVMTAFIGGPFFIYLLRRQRGRLDR